jgi:hypothetical protein
MARVVNVTVSLKRTQSLPNYSNIAPEVSYEIELAPGDNPGAVTDIYYLAAETFVEGKIDEALELNNQPALYSREPRFDLVGIRIGRERFGIILPSMTEPPRELYTYNIIGRLRYGHMLKYCAEQGFSTLLDCTEQELSDIWYQMKKVQADWEGAEELNRNRQPLREIIYEEEAEELEEGQFEPAEEGAGEEPESREELEAELAADLAMLHTYLTTSTSEAVAGGLATDLGTRQQLEAELATLAEEQKSTANEPQS